MKRAARLGISIMFLAIHGLADTYVRQPSIDVVHYDVSIELTDTADSLSGTTRVHVLMRDHAVSSMWLDFAGMTVDELSVGGVQQPFVRRDDRLSFALGRPYSRNEIAVIEVRYSGKPQNGGMLTRKNNYGQKVFFAENWPDHAHRWFPSIDHPSDKATVDFEVTAPAKYQVVANGRLVETRSMPNGRKLTRWSESRNIPTYCMVVGAAEFAVEHRGDANGVPLEWYYYPQDSAAAALVFRRSADAVRYFGELIGPYPYEKLAQVQSTTEISGMENSSAIFYSEELFQSDKPAQDLVPHEIAHQWFGDSVTEADWDHLWLSEGFASYFDTLFSESMQGPESLRQAMTRAAEVVKKLCPDTPVINPDIKDPMKKLNAATYLKGAWVLHMLRGILGDDLFFAGIRHYYGLYQGKNVLTEDFQKAMESVSGASLSAFFRQWLHQAGWPDYRITWHWNKTAGEVELTVRQAQKTGLFDMPVEIAILGKSQRATHTIHVSRKTQTFRILFPAEPSSVELDPNGWILKSVTVLQR